MNSFFGNISEIFALQLPLTGVMHHIDFLFLFFESQLIFGVFKLDLTFFLVKLKESMNFVSYVFEKGAKILFKHLVLISNDIPPLYHHIVEGNINVIHFSKTFSQWNFIQHHLYILMKLSKVISNLIESVDFLCK